MSTDRVPLSQTAEKGDVPTPAENTVAQVAKPERSGLGYMDDLEYHRVADALDIGYEDRKVGNMAEKLSFLYDWAKEISKSDDRIRRIEAIKGLQRQLGVQGTGPETIKKLWQYARLDQNRIKIEKEMSLLSADTGVK